jgi:hypothetical protein
VLFRLTGTASPAAAAPGHGGGKPNNGGTVNDDLIKEGKRTFRFDTFGDDLAVGLKVDVDALPQSVQDALAAGQVNLDDPAVTLSLLKLNAVVGVKGTFDSAGNLQAAGIECALCHSTVDDSFAPGIGPRLDGWANRDLNVGAIVGLSPNLQPVATLLHTDVPTVQKVLASWGPGKFDADLFMDGKAFQPGRQVGSDPDPARVRAGRGQPAHLHRLGFGAVLERLRGEPGDARPGELLRSAAGRRQPVPDSRGERVRARQVPEGPDNPEATRPARLPAVPKGAEAADGVVRRRGGRSGQGAVQRQGAVLVLPRAAHVHRARAEPPPGQ